MIVQQITVTEKQGRTTVNIVPQVAPAIWKMYKPGEFNQSTGSGPLDIDGAQNIQNDERTRIARELFYHAIDILDELNKRKEFNAFYGDIVPEPDKTHYLILMRYARKAFYYTKVLTPFEYDTMEPVFDESGILMGMKQLPKKETDEIEQYLQAQNGSEDEQK
jgi:hypothetical protein